MFTVSYGTTPQLQHNVQKKRWVPNENENNFPSRFRFADDANCGDFMLLFCRERLRNVQSLKRTCWAIVLPIRSFVFPCPRCRRRRLCGLLKVPSIKGRLKKLGGSLEFYRALWGDRVNFIRHPLKTYLTSISNYCTKRQFLDRRLKKVSNELSFRLSSFIAACLIICQ